MKNYYEQYGRKAAQLEKNLSSRDKEILAEFLNFCGMTAGGNQISQYRHYLLQFRDILEKPLDQVTKDDAIRFWGLVKSSRYQEHTKLKIRKMVRRFLKWQYRDLDMIESLKIPSNYLVNKHKVNKAVLLTESEIQCMLHRAERLRDKTILILLYETAARPQEVRELKWGDINWDEKEVHLFSRKTKDDRDLPLQESLKQLKRWKEEWIYPDPQQEDYVFPSSDGSFYNRKKPISISYINRIIKSLARKAGITRNIYPYLLRHTRLTELHNRGVQGIEFKKFAGHTPGSNMENVYVHMDNADMKRSVIEKIYKIQEVTPSEKYNYEKRIERLEKQLHEVITFLKESKGIISSVKEHLEAADQYS